MFRALAAKVYADVLPLLEPFTTQCARFAQTVIKGLGIYAEIAKFGDLPLGIEHDHRDVVVVVEHLEHKVEVGILVGLVQRAHGLGPHLHLAMLLFLEVARQKMRHKQ